MKKPRMINVVLAGGTVVLLGTAAVSMRSAGAADAPPRTVKASTGTVQTTVSASGNVAVPSQLSVAFPSGGKLAEVDVAVGQHVTKGQVLAKLDPTTANANLASAQADLTSAQARLQQTTMGLTPQEQSQDAAAASQAQVSVTNDQQALADAQHLQQVNAVNDQTAVDQAQQMLSFDQQRLDQDQNQLASDSRAGSSAASAVATDQRNIVSDQQAIIKDQAAVVTAQSSQTAGVAKDQQSVDQARNTLNTSLAALQKAQADNAVKAQPPKPGDLATAQSSVALAQQQVDTAQRSVDDLTLVAPSDGTVAGVNGLVGEYIGGGSSGGGASSASSSGSSGGSSTGGSSGGSSSGGSSGSSSSSSASSGGSSASSPTGSSAFISLTDLNDLEVQAGFPETDAAKIRPDQTVAVSFDAIGGQSLPGKVVSVSPTSTLVSNVVTYQVTVSLDQIADGLKPGMTGNVAVTVGEKDGVVRVPSAAIQGGGNTATVTKYVNGQSVTTPVTIGLRADDFVEITSGVSDGDDIVIPTAGGTSGAASATRTATGSAGGAAGSGLGGGGGGFGGGGGGGFGPGGGGGGGRGG